MLNFKKDSEGTSHVTLKRQHKIKDSKMNKCDIINMNRANIYKKSNGAYMSNTAEIKKLIQTLAERAEREIKDVGYFRDIIVKGEKGADFGTFAKNIALIIEKDPREEGKAFLSVSALHPQLEKDSTTYLIKGNREEILKFLHKDNFLDNLKATIGALDSQLRELR